MLYYTLNAMKKDFGKEILEALYLEKKSSIRDIAELLGWSKDKVFRLIEYYGIKRDRRIRRPKISNISLEYLKKEFKTKSKNQVAKELGISRATLYNYLSRLINI